MKKAFALSIFIFFALLGVLLYPLTGRSNFVVSILVFIVDICIVVTFILTKKISKIERFSIYVFALICNGGMFLDIGKLVFALTTLLFLVTLTYIVYQRIKYGKKFSIINTICISSLSLSAYPILLLTNIDSTLTLENIHYIVFYVIATIVSLIICTIIAQKNYNITGKSTDLYIIPIISIIVTSVICWTLISSVNFSLDTKVMDETEYRILDKRTSGTRRVYYYVKIRYEGQLYDIAVSRNTYDAYRVGDNIKLKSSKGVFNITYFTGS